MNPNSKKNILIIGAGPAGLTLAYELLSRDLEHFDVTILEQQEIVGGLAQTYNHKGNRIDIGGHRFFSKSQRVMDWWFGQMPLQGHPASDYKKLNITSETKAGGPDPETQDVVMLARRRLSRIFRDRKFFDYPLSITRDTISKFGIVDLFLCGRSYMTAKFHKYDMSNLEGFYKSRFGVRLYERFFNAYTHKVRGKRPKDVSAARGAQRVKGLNLAKAVRDYFKKIIIGDKQSTNTETSLIGKFYYPKFGPGQMREIVADKVLKLGGNLVMNAQFKSSKLGVLSSKHELENITYKKDGKHIEFQPDFVVSTMPIKNLLGSMEGADPEVVRLAGLLEYRDFITVGILAKKLLVKNVSDYKTINNIIPDNRIYIHDKGTIVGRIQLFNNWSPYLVKDPDTVWLGMEYFCDQGDELWVKTDEELIALGIQELVTMGFLDKADVLDGVVRRMEYTYPCYFGEGYDKFDMIKNYLDSIENLYCIGRNGAHRYNNQDHSMLSSMILADQLIEGNINRNILRSINTEEEYHENK